jgi:hypothetical protein
MKSNLQFFLCSYSDLVPTTAPSQNNFKWLREINGIPFNTENDQQIQILPSASTPNIVPYPFSTPTNSGTNSINSTVNMTVIGSTSGIAVGNLIVGGGIPVGTTVQSIGTSQFTFTTSSANATAGAVYSNNGQNFTVSSTIVAGTTLVTTGPGVPTSSGTLTLVSGTGDATITFSAFAEATLLVMTQAATTTGSSGISFYAPASFVYFETDQQVSVIYNNGTAMVLNPFQVNGMTQPAVFFMAGPCYSFSVTNMSSTTTANIFFASMG